MPCIDGTWDKSQWSHSTVFSSSVSRSSLWDAVRRNRMQSPKATSRNEAVRFWPLTNSEALGNGGSILSGEYVRQFSVVV